jgi:hypothetical protein
MTLNDSLSMLEDVSFAFLKLRFPTTEEGVARKKALLDYIGTPPSLASVEPWRSVTFAERVHTYASAGKFYSGQSRIAEEEREMWARPHNKLPIHKSLAAIAFRSSV